MTHNKPYSYKIFRTLRTREKIKAFKKEKQFIYKRSRIGLASEFSIVTLDTCRKWRNTFKILRENDFKPEIIYPNERLI